MTFFQAVMRIFAAAGAMALIELGPKLIALFQGAAPSDIPAMLWALIGIVGVFLVNLGVGKIKLPPSLTIGQ